MESEIAFATTAATAEETSMTEEEVMKRFAEGLADKFSSEEPSTEETTTEPEETTLTEDEVMERFAGGLADMFSSEE